MLYILCDMKQPGNFAESEEREGILVVHTDGVADKYYFILCMVSKNYLFLH